MKKTSIFLILALVFVVIPFSSALCTVTFDEETYSSGETITSTMLCDDATEKSKPYSLTWTYSNGTTLEMDMGVTPSIAGTSFFQTYSTLGFQGIINATLTGSNLEGTDYANVTSTSSNSLFIVDASFSPSAFLGESFSTQFTVVDENEKRISGATCSIYGTDENNAPLQVCGVSKTVDGIGLCEGKLDQAVFEEGDGYLVKIRCSCGIDGSICYDDDGVDIGGGDGSNTYPFTVSTWLTSNTVTNKDSYVGREEIFICANLTNIDSHERIPVEIYHQIRCSAGDDNDNDLDRALINTDDGQPDERGIETGTTQMQCKRFIIPELNYLQGTVSECSASTSVWILDDSRNKIKNYVTTSPSFNITVTDINIDADWQKTGDYEFNTIVNLSEDKYSAMSPSLIGNIDIRLDKNYEESIRAEDQYFRYPVDIQNFIDVENILSISAFDSDGDAIEAVIEILDDGNIEIELKDIDFVNDGYANVTMKLNSFREREVGAFEGMDLSLESVDLDDEIKDSLKNIYKAVEGLDFGLISGDTVTFQESLDTINKQSGQILSAWSDGEQEKDEKSLWIAPAIFFFLLIILLVAIFRKRRGK